MVQWYKLCGTRLISILCIHVYCVYMQETDRVHVEEDHYGQMSFRDRYFLASDKDEHGWVTVTVSVFSRVRETDTADVGRCAARWVTRWADVTGAASLCVCCVISRSVVEIATAVSHFNRRRAVWCCSRQAVWCCSPRTLLTADIHMA